MSQEIEIVVPDVEATISSHKIDSNTDIENSPKTETTTTIESVREPLSPASSSSASQTNTFDSTFEPTIDMLVNDFDNEQTLEEEEGYAELEDPNDEITTLREESEMPLEELLAKYRQFEEIAEEKESRENNQHSKIAAARKKSKNTHHNTEKTKKFSKAIDDDTVSSEEVDDANRKDEMPQNQNANAQDLSSPETTNSFEKENIDNQFHHQRRTHLMELYPENFLKMIEMKTSDSENCGDYDLYDDDDFEEDEDDLGYAKKTIMVGSAYQAVIPVGLSKYGDDLLPYENEDKLIWEPSQVSEAEVEEYLIKAKEIRPSLSEDELLDDRVKSDSPFDINSTELESMEKPAVSTPCNALSTPHSVAYAKMNAIESENVISVKDNEQALHLLVQCGYDFKEGLRRQRLNAGAHNVDVWSEEECKKFEEGIQKYGKDFLKIRQNQVRTRSMRELVQFYYLWKKSERRDQDFADSDHMDLYLNEGTTTSPSTNANHITNTSGLSTDSSTNTKAQTSPMTLLTVVNSNNKLQSSTSFQNKKIHSNVVTQKNFSIMNEAKQRLTSGGNLASNSIEVANSVNKSTSLKKVSNARRRGDSSSIDEVIKVVPQSDSQSPLATVKNSRSSTNSK